MEFLNYFLLILGCFVASAFFSCSETALMRLRSQDLERDIEAAHGPAALAVRDLLSSTSRLLITVLVGNNVVNILAASAMTALSVAILGEKLGIFVATLVTTILVLVFCEILPKAVAAAHPRGISYGVAMPLYLFHQLLRPIHALFDSAINPLVRRITGRSPDEPMSSPEEVLRLALQTREGQPAGSPLAIIGAAAGAAEMTAAQIMVPRTEIVAFPQTISPTELLEKMLEERYTRVPIYEGDIDHMLGVVHLKDLVKLVHDGGKEFSGILKTVLRVPGRKPILRLLTDMQRAFVHLAVVKDEFGVTLGLITQEDILEEIVGEIRDEFDREELLTIRRLESGSYQALGRIKVLDFNRESGWQVPAEPGDTLSGLVFNTLGRAPRKGDVVRVGHYEVAVIDLSGTRIAQVRINRLVEEEPEEHPVDD